jgi:hypothetical protein
LEAGAGSFVRAAAGSSTTAAVRSDGCPTLLIVLLAQSEQSRRKSRGKKTGTFSRQPKWRQEIENNGR